MPSSRLHSIQQAQDPLHEDITPEIHQEISTPMTRVVSAAAQRKHEQQQPEPNCKKKHFLPLQAPPASCRQVFVRRRHHPTHAYEIVPPEAFQPIKLSHGGPTWGHVFMGYKLPRYSIHPSGEAPKETALSAASHAPLSSISPVEGLYREAIDENDVQKVATKRLDLRIVLPELQEGYQEHPFREIHRLQTMGDDIHVLSIVEALQDRHYLYIVTPWCDGGGLSERIPLRLHPRCSLLSSEQQETTQQPQKRQSVEDKVRVYFQQMMEALEYIHGKHGVGHRDIKPGNFLICD
jgi:serine/threonine protein kinase